MALSDFYESTILEVSANFGFSGFDFDPDVLSRALDLHPASVSRKGEKRKVGGGREIDSIFNSWSIESTLASKDVNVHLRALLLRIAGKEALLTPEFGQPAFSIVWKGNYLYAGSGPFYEADVIQGIASWGAELWQDIYQIDQDDQTPIGDLGLIRIPKWRS